MIHKDYICSVLGRFEGKAIAKGYVPCDRTGVPLGASGVTIGTGFDLGQQTLGNLRALGLPDALREKLVPYLGLRRDAAVKALAERPLCLATDEVKTLDDAVHEKYINETAALFGPRFETAPKQAQAVAVSLHYQFGTLAREASPSLAAAWKAMRFDNYDEAAQLLSNSKGWSQSHRQYMVRRRAEAALLEEIGA